MVLQRARTAPLAPACRRDGRRLRRGVLHDAARGGHRAVPPRGRPRRPQRRVAGPPGPASDGRRHRRRPGRRRDGHASRGPGRATGSRCSGRPPRLSGGRSDDGRTGRHGDLARDARAHRRRTSSASRPRATHARATARLTVTPPRPDAVDVSADTHETGPGGSVTIRGLVSSPGGAPLPGQEVVLQVRGPQRWRPVATATSDAFGAVAISTPAAERTSVYRLRSGPITSSRWRVVLVPSLTAAVTAGTPGEPTDVTVTALGAQAGDTVALLRRVDGTPGPGAGDHPRRRRCGALPGRPGQEGDAVRRPAAGHRAPRPGPGPRRHPASIPFAYAAWPRCWRSSLITLTSRTASVTGGSQDSSTTRSRSSGPMVAR